MRNLHFPLNLQFKVSTLASDFVVTDNAGDMVAYVRQKLFKLKEDVNVYADDNKSELLFNIKANQWLDFSASYQFADVQGNKIGRVARKGWRSLWRSHYDIIDENDQLQFTVQESNPWVKVADGLLGELPLMGLVTGYLLNPTYLVRRAEGPVVARLIKRPSFWGRKFEVTKERDLSNQEQERVLLGLMMMVLLERSRG